MELKDVVGYEGFYQVDCLGRIYSLAREVIVTHPKYGVRLQLVPSKIRKCSEHSTGYLTIRLAKNGVVKTHRVHRIVAEAWIPNLEDKSFVNHLNGNKKDNRVDNLEWASPKENTTHAIINGLKPTNNRCETTGRYLPNFSENKE